MQDRRDIKSFKRFLNIERKDAECAEVGSLFLHRGPLSQCREMNNGCLITRAVTLLAEHC